MATLRSIADWLTPRRRLITLTLVGWTAVIVLASGSVSDVRGWLTVPDLGWLLAGFVGLLALIGLVVIMVFRPLTMQVTEQRSRKRLRLPFLAIAVFVLLLVVFAPDEIGSLGELETTTSSTEVPVVAGTTVDTIPPSETRSRDVVLLLLAGFAALLVVWRSARRFEPPPPRPLTQPEIDDDTIAPIIEQAARDLELGGEPRRAVLIAYARLEADMSERGFERLAQETTTEHMTRALAAFPTLITPVVRLGELYELARYSQTPITATDQRRAMEALRAAQTSLAESAGRVK